jgi:DNA adenine methylase
MQPNLLKRVPHPFAYQGSKRKLASTILSYFPPRTHCLYEPFCGSAALSLAALYHRRCSRVVLNDLFAPLMALWTEIRDAPERVADAYAERWLAQIPAPREHYLQVRESFNQRKEGADLLFLLSRCVKASVRFNHQGQFNQAADHRRLGVRPPTLRQHLVAAAQLLTDRSVIRAGDFAAALAEASSEDLVYLDPPYQGTSQTRDHRYIAGLNRHHLESCIADLMKRGVPLIVSFDGRCGEKTFGPDLAAELGLIKLTLHAGKSSQSTLVGRHDETFESLYLSPQLTHHGKGDLQAERSASQQREGASPEVPS